MNEVHGTQSQGLNQDSALIPSLYLSSLTYKMGIRVLPTQDLSKAWLRESHLNPPPS